MVFEKNLVGLTITKEKWFSRDYGVIVLSDGRAIILNVDVIDDALVVKQMILDRKAILQAEIDSIPDLTT
jgi:hypothetical protein